MTKIHFFDFSTPSHDPDFSTTFSRSYSRQLQLLRRFAKADDISWEFDFDEATPDEIYFWTEADLIVRAERAFSQDKIVFLEGCIVELNDFCHFLALFSRVFGSLPDVTSEDFYSISFASPVKDMKRHYQFVGRLLGAPV